MSTVVTTKRRRSLTAMLLLLPLGLTACSSGSGGLSIGMKRASVDLSFTDTSIPPLPPKVITSYLNQVLTQSPGSAGAVVPPETTILPQPPPVALGPRCKKFDEFAVHSAKPLSSGVTVPMTAGTYQVVNKGTIALGSPTGGKPALTQKFPLLTTMQVSNVNEKQQPADPHDNVGGQDLPTELFPSQAYYGGTWDVKEDLGNGSYTVTTYLLQKEELDLVKRISHVAKTILTPEVTNTFTPAQPMKIMGVGAANGGIGTNWESAGVDPTTGEIGVIRGSTLVSKVVDVCGNPVNAYVVTESERYYSVSASGGVFLSETNDNVVNSDTKPSVGIDPSYNGIVNNCASKPGACDPTNVMNLRNTYLVANQYGGLFVGKLTHMTTLVPPLAITVNNVATLTSVTPKKGT